MESPLKVQMEEEPVEMVQEAQNDDEYDDFDQQFQDEPVKQSAAAAQQMDDFGYDDMNLDALQKKGPSKQQLDIN